MHLPPNPPSPPAVLSLSHESGKVEKKRRRGEQGKAEEKIGPIRDGQDRGDNGINRGEQTGRKEEVKMVMDWMEF